MTGEWRGPKMPDRCQFWYWVDGGATRQCCRKFDHPGEHKMRAVELEDFGNCGNFRRLKPSE